MSLVHCDVEGETYFSLQACPVDPGLALNRPPFPNSLPRKLGSRRSLAIFQCFSGFSCLFWRPVFLDVCHTRLSCCRCLSLDCDSRNPQALSRSSRLSLLVTSGLFFLLSYTLRALQCSDLRFQCEEL